MNERTEVTENTTEGIQLYSIRAITGATYLGGPLAAGYMISENFKALDQPKQGKTAFIISIVFTIVLFAVLFSIPEHIVDRSPNVLIPVVYTAIIWSIVENKQGKVLAAHKKNGNVFYSGWRAAGIGFISLLLLALGIVGVVFFSPGTAELEQFDTEITAFIANEEATMVFYDHIETENNYNLLQELEKITIPKWKENIAITKRLIQLPNLPSEQVEQSKLLLTYSELRLEVFELLQLAIQEDTDQYDAELDRLYTEINKTVDQMD